MTRGTRRPDLIRLRWLWYSISIAGLVVGIGSMVMHGRQAAREGRSFIERLGLNAGIDFTGGAMFRYKLPNPFDESQEAAKQVEFRAAIETTGLARFKIQTVGTGALRNYLNVQTQALTEADQRTDRDRLTQALTAKEPGITLEESTLVGPVVSNEILVRALEAFLLGTVIILLYIAVRYDFMFGICAVVALLHDIFIMLGWASLARLEVDSAFVAAVLCVIGYSVNDTIIIFDRIRENLRRMQGRPFAEICNYSLWETMARSINTLLAVLFILFALLFFGGVTIKSFVAAMTVGFISGGYSSIFNAAQLLTGWKTRREARQRRPGAQASTASGTARSRLAPSPSRPAPAPTPSRPALESGMSAASADLDALATPPPLPDRASEDVLEARRERRKERKAPKLGKRKRRH